MAGLWDWLQKPNVAEGFAALGQIAGAADFGEVADVSPYLARMDQNKQNQAFRDAMSGDDMMGRFSPEERSFLTTLPPEIAQNFIAERIFAQAEPIDLQTFNGPDGTVYQFNPRTGQTAPLTGAKPSEAFRQITGQEAQSMGLDPAKAYNVGPDGKISAIGDAGVTVNNNMGGDKFGEAWAKNDADALASLSDAGMAAMRNQPRIDQLDALLQSNPTGGLANFKVAAGEWGVNTEGLDDLQVAQSIINTMVPEQRQPGSGPMSDSDLALFKQSLPRIINQPGGNRMIIDTLRAIAEYDAEGARIIQRGRNNELSRAEMFQLLQERENPLAGLVAPSSDRAKQTESDWSDVGGVKIRRKGE